MSAAAQVHLTIDLNVCIPLLCFFGFFIFGCGRVCKYLFGLLETYYCKNSVTIEYVQQFLDILKSLGTQQGAPPKSPDAKPSAPEGTQPKIAPASKLKFKTVNEVYVPNGVIKLWLTIHPGGMRKILNIKSRNLQQQK